MEFFYWCSHPLCPCFDQYPEFQNMSVVPRELIVRNTYPIPGRGQHIYGGIYQLARHKMLGVGINPDYILNACLNDNILLVAVEPVTTTITKTKILGFVSLNIHNSRCIEINVIASRNNHGGVGTTLMFHALRIARSCGFSVCFLKALVPAMEFLAKQGFTVIRMGREGNSQVNSKHPNVIDYCFSAHKSDFADFFLTSKAEFAICTDTGMVHLPLFFRKPIGIANIAGIHGLLHTKMVKFITFKRCFDNKLMRNLSLSEILNSDLIGYKDNYMFHNTGIIFVDSSPDELVGLVKDMFYFISSSSFSNSKSRKLNIEFQDLVFTKRKIKMWSSISHTWLQNNRDFLE